MDEYNNRLVDLLIYSFTHLLIFNCDANIAYQTGVMSFFAKNKMMLQIIFISF